MVSFGLRNTWYSACLFVYVYKEKRNSPPSSFFSRMSNRRGKVVWALAQRRPKKAGLLVLAWDADEE
jgi:hypothetical protein